MPDPDSLPTAQIVQDSDRWWYVALDRSWVLEWSRLRDSRAEGLSAEIRAFVPEIGRASTPSSYTLTSPISRGRVAKQLERAVPGPDWTDLLDKLTGELLAAIRQGATAFRAVPVQPAGQDWLMEAITDYVEFMSRDLDEGS